MALSLISIIQVFILIGITNIYIVDKISLFLLCLENIDTLGIHLKNIII